MEEFQKTRADVRVMNEASDEGWSLVTVYVGQLEYYRGPIALWKRPKEPAAPTDVDGEK